MSKKANPIIKSWKVNAQKWIDTIANDEIESRRLVTNSAIIKSILEYRPSSFLDIGCGEGWLVEVMSNRGVKSIGIDGTKALIEYAQKNRKGRFAVMSYEELIKGANIIGQPFELIAINFALFENKKTTRLIKKLPNYLTNNGKIVIQTLHPFAKIKEGCYESSWQKDSWNGLKRNFAQPHKWYFRTLEDWIELFQKAGLKLIKLKEPTHPKTKLPLSIIFVLEKSDY